MRSATRWGSRLRQRPAAALTDCCLPAPRRVRFEAGKNKQIERHYMLYTIAVVLVVLWLVGMLASFTLGGLIHILLALAVIMVLVNLFSGRNKSA
jgi:Flp pilus assembly protein TadB